MGFDVSALSNYSDEQSKNLVIRSQFANKTANFATKHIKVKSSKKVQKLAATVYMQDGDGCGYTSTGSVDLTQATLTTYPIKFNQDFCVRDLESKWTQILLNAGQEYSEVDMPAAIRAAILGEFGELFEKADWKGSTASGDPNLNRYNGIIKIVADAGDATEANVVAYYGTPATALNATTMSGAVDAMCKAFNANVPGSAGKATVKIFMGREKFDSLRVAYRNANYFGFNGTNDQGNDEMRVLGSNYTCVAVDGLNGIDKMYMIDSDNLHIGMDGEGEEEKLDMWLDPSTRETIKSKMRLRRGWCIPYTDEVITFII